MVIKMKSGERDLILRHAFLSPELDAKLRLGVREGKLLVFHLDSSDAEDLAQCLEAEARRAADRKLRRLFERLYERVERVLEKQAGQVPGDDVFPSGMDPRYHREVERLFASREFASLDEANRELGKIADGHNRRPRPEFYGLSPAQVRGLLDFELGAPDSLLHLRDDLSFDEVEPVEIYHNAVVFLKALKESGGTKATTTGNLNRKFVLDMLDTMRWSEGYVEDVWRFNKVLNESDVTLLHVLRIILEMAGLIRKYKGQFVTTKKGRSFLSEQKAGALYAGLFSAYFTKFNLAYTDGMPEYPDIQRTATYSLCMLSRRAQEWRVAEELAQEVFLPAVAQDIQPRIYTDARESLLRMRIVSPLKRFGLVDCEYDEEQTRFFFRLTRVRVTPLFNRFLEFDLDRA